MGVGAAVDTGGPERERVPPGGSDEQHHGDGPPGGLEPAAVTLSGGSSDALSKRSSRSPDTQRSSPTVVECLLVDSVWWRHVTAHCVCHRDPAQIVAVGV